MSDHVDTIVLAPSTFSSEEFGGKGNHPGSANRPASSRPSGQPAPSSAAPSAEEVRAALQRVNEHLAATDRLIELQVDPETHLTIATIRDSSTGEVLQQYPAADSLHLAQMLAAWSDGGNLLLDLIA